MRWIPMIPSTRPSWLVQTSDLAVTYRNGHKALHPTSLTIYPGEFLVLLGASGAGKSTLLRSLNGLVRPTQGEICLSDIDRPQRNARAMREHRRRTGMVFQQHHLIGRQTVLANVLMGRVATRGGWRSEEHTSELQSLMRISYAVFCLKKKQNST